MRGVEQFTRETKLVKRVNEWENRIVPILEEQDKHEEFDLHKNRYEIIDELKEKKGIDVPVAELASERQSYEVSRMFVSLLQMVLFNVSGLNPLLVIPFNIGITLSLDPYTIQGVFLCLKSMLYNESILDIPMVSTLIIL